MQKHLKKRIYFITGIIPLFIISSSVYAKPWLDAGDSRLRHQLQLLSDNGLLNAPSTTWPLSSKDIHGQLAQVNENTVLAPEVLQAIAEVNKRLREEDYTSGFKIIGEANSKELLLRDFSGKGREQALIAYDGEWGNPIVDIRLKATATDAKNHYRLDESYLASSFGNWKFTVGKQSRWWGPGWDGSLILSNNARPIPSLSLDRVESTPFSHKYLRWMGPWKLSIFAGKLESSRVVPNVKLLGARVNFKPTPNFEVGLSRTAQWGGDGRSQSLSTLFNTIIGKDNFYADDPGKSKEPGNQLAGIDFRWNSPLIKNKSYALYGQLIGEDEAGKLPFKNIGLLGLETWGYSKKFNGSWRVYLEASDTSTDFLQGEPRNNTAYNHGIYKDGYRYQGASLGHGIDSDSQIVGIGGILAQRNGNLWQAWIKHAQLNTDGAGKNTIAPKGLKWTGVGISLEKSLNWQTKINAGVQLISEKGADDSTDTDVGISLGFTHLF